MLWTQSDTIGLAKSSCAHCQGLGLRTTEKKERQRPCNCVFRAIFRACYARFRECLEREKTLSRVSLEFYRGGKDRRYTYERKTEDYIADFCLVSRRFLDESDHKVFRFHFLLGADWRLCCRQLGMDRGNFFHAVYRIEQILGRAFRELEPYGLFPLDEYFGRRAGNETPRKAQPLPEKVKVMPVRVARRPREERKSA